MLGFQRWVSTVSEIFMRFLNSLKIFQVQLYDWMKILNSKLKHNIHWIILFFLQRFSSLYSCFNRANSNIMSFAVSSLSNANFKKQLEVILNAVFGIYYNVLRGVLCSTVHVCHWSRALNKAHFNRNNCGYSIRRDATESCYWIRKILQLQNLQQWQIGCLHTQSVSRLQINTSWS
jgi:hypothetical protein